MSFKWNETENFSSLNRNFNELDTALKNLMNFSKEYVTLLLEFENKAKELYNKYLKEYSTQKNFSSIMLKNVCKIIIAQIEGFKPLIVGLKKRNEISEKFLFEKEILNSKIKNEVLNSKKDLEEKYIIIKKNRNNFEQVANEGEDLILEFYKSKKTFNETKKTNSIKNMEPILQRMKTSEKEYKKSVKTALKYEDNLLTTLNISNSNLIILCKEYAKILKDSSIEYLVHYRSINYILENELQNSLPKLNDYNIEEQFEKKINKESSRCFPFQKTKLKPYKIKIIKKNSFCKDLYKKENELGVKETYEIVKKIYEYLSIKDEEYDLKVEEEKLLTNNITNKILSFTKKTIPLPEETEEEIKIIIELIQKKENSKIFITKLNDFRTLGIFEIPKKKYDEIGSIMYAIMDNVLINDDLDISKKVMILSQTYYIKDENQNKIYLQNVIQKNPIFKNINFWKKFIQNSINNEINESVRKDKKNGTLMIDNQKENTNKYNNIVFSQLISLANNMIEFGLDKENIKSLILENCESYRINENSRKIVMDLIEGEK